MNPPFLISFKNVATTFCLFISVYHNLIILLYLPSSYSSLFQFCYFYIIFIFHNLQNTIYLIDCPNIY